VHVSPIPTNYFTPSEPVRVGIIRTGPADSNSVGNPNPFSNFPEARSGPLLVRVTRLG
jgi:hypothetical protein